MGSIDSNTTPLGNSNLSIETASSKKRLSAGLVASHLPKENKRSRLSLKDLRGKVRENPDFSGEQKQVALVYNKTIRD